MLINWYNPASSLLFLVQSLCQQSIALFLTLSSFTMSDSDTAAPSAGEASSTLLTSQLAPLDLLVLPQQESAKSAISLKRNLISPTTMHTSQSAFFNLTCPNPPAINFPSLALIILPYSAPGRPSNPLGIPIKQLFLLLSSTLFAISQSVCK